MDIKITAASFAELEEDDAAKLQTVAEELSVDAEALFTALAKLTDKGDDTDTEDSGDAEEFDAKAIAAEARK